ncbi:S8/S53 family peptidase [Soonwooa sp.]|uniref:S8/S53 family peptidase n=1 Tax=Soonwooa sp. TaxID=1938592 RepID=UPI00262BB7D4|nr:S8/S53 family peptidase [Soonwooa sp.]
MKKIFTSLLLGGLFFGQAQQTELVFVFFKDKPNKATFFANPLSELSQKSLDRRTQKSIPLNDQDAPIEASYIQNVKNLGFMVTDYSKWLNGVAVNATKAQIQNLQSQSYVSHVESFVRNPNGGKKAEADRPQKWKNIDANKTNFNYGEGSAQIDQINLRPLHVAGYTGAGITIAVIDTGFPTVNTGSAYKRMRDNGHIKGGYNFVTKSNDIYNINVNTHGAFCLGAIAGFVQDQFVGTAPDADFYLYASENAEVEIPEEQLYWIEAAEEADRKGVDLISTSLGYSEFDDSRYDYTYADMNGTTTFIARGAQIAYEKGIFVSFAAGNEATSAWHYITSPADNAKVFSIGAVDESGTSASFSSFGPNSVGVIKPDVDARGVATATVFGNGVNYGNGTSLANPVAAGGVASLLQALPKNINLDVVKSKLRATASRANAPTDQQGYGILNFGSAINQLLSVNNLEQKKMTIYPNPAKDVIEIQSNSKIESVQIFDNLGRLIKTENASKINVSKLEKGVYYLKINGGEKIEKFIKD